MNTKPKFPETLREFSLFSYNFELRGRQKRSVSRASERLEEQETRAKMEGKGGEVASAMGSMSLEALEAINKELEQRAATSVAAAEQALRAVQNKEEDLAQNAEKIVQAAAMKAAHEDVAVSRQGKENEAVVEDPSETPVRAPVRTARSSSARRAAQEPLSKKKPAQVALASSTPKAAKPAAPSSSKPSSVTRAPRDSPTQPLSTFPSDFDLPSRPDAQVRLCKARIKALEADLQAQEVSPSPVLRVSGTTLSSLRASPTI